MYEDLEKRLSKLGLNKKQTEAYIYILKNKRVNLRTLADKFDITTAGVSKLLKDMVERGFIKSFEVGNKKVFVATDIREFRDQYLKSKREEMSDYEKIFEDLEAGFGGYSIKVHRLSSDKMKNTVKEWASKKEEFYEYADLQGFVNPNTKLPPHFAATKYYGLFSNGPEGYKHEVARSIDVAQGLHAAVRISDSKVMFSTSNKESIQIENEEVANTMRDFMRIIFEAQGK